MADRMEFPKTIKEFIDSYSFKDREEIYTNGAELIPVFRVEQAIEYYEKEIRAKAIDEFANFIHEKAKENNGLRLSQETRSWTHPCIYDYLEEFKNEQICKGED